MKPKNKPGQGRPTINGERKMLSIRLPVNLVAKLPENKTQFIEAAILAALENEMFKSKMYFSGRVIYTGQSLKAAMYAAKHESQNYIDSVDVYFDSKRIGSFRDGHFER